jgi:hypothetical protein
MEDNVGPVLILDKYTVVDFARFGWYRMFCEYGDDISGFIKAELFWHKKDPVTWN